MQDPKANLIIAFQQAGKRRNGLCNDIVDREHCQNERGKKHSSQYK